MQRSRSYQVLMGRKPAAYQRYLFDFQYDEYHQKQIDRIEGKNGEAFDEALQQSMARLGHREYLDALKAHGVSVPDYFYQRLRD